MQPRSAAPLVLAVLVLLFAPAAGHAARGDIADPSAGRRGRPRHRLRPSRRLEPGARGSTPAAPARIPPRAGGRLVRPAYARGYALVPVQARLQDHRPRQPVDADRAAGPERAPAARD